MAEPTNINIDGLESKFAGTIPESRTKALSGNFNIVPEPKLGKDAYYVRLTLGKYKRPTVHEEGLFHDEAVIRLPLPLEMRDDTDVNYSNVDLQNVGDVFNGQSSAGALALRNGEDIASAAGDAASVISSKFGKLANQVTENLTGAAGKLLPPALIVSALSQKYGVAANPNPSVQFMGPSLRTFTFTWNFNPRSAAESKLIHSTIKLLKASALPTLNDVSNASLLEYPRMARLNFNPWDSMGATVDSRHAWTTESIFRFGFCVMQNVNVNYAPSQAPAFFKETHGPAMITLSITFREIEYLLSYHWSDDGNELYGKGISNTEAEQIEQAKTDTASIIKQDNLVKATTETLSKVNRVIFIYDQNNDGKVESVEIERNMDYQFFLQQHPEAVGPFLVPQKK